MRQHDERPGGRARAVRLTGELALLTCIGATAATLLGFLGAASWLLDLFAHFRVHYLYALVVAAGVLAGLSRWRSAAVAWTAATANLLVIAPLYLPGGPTAAADAPRLKVMSFNVLASNRRHADIVDYVTEQAPDLALLLEVTPELDGELRALPGYRMVSEARRDSFGIALLARNEVALSVGKIRFADSELPAVQATVMVGTTAVTVLGIHPPPPASSALSAERDRILGLAADWSRQTPGPRVIAGDFNTTPWGRGFDLLTDAGLRDSARGFGVQPTWPGSLSALAIPIDHLVHSPELAVVDRRTGPWLGSDHRPLQVTLAPALPAAERR